MRVLSCSDCLNLWESGAGLHPLDQGLLTLGVALPGTSHAALADWPLGKRNLALVQLSCASFGSLLQGWMACGNCNENLEIEMDGQALVDSSADENRTLEEPILFKGQSFRLPTTRDLARAAKETDVRLAAIRLADSCCLETAESRDWSDDDLDHLGRRLAMADPLAEIRLALRCPVCGNEWTENLDIISFLWREIEARARKLLFEVHTLASAYGWSEADILSMSDNRRALYLEMAQS
jgi:hypothetical protein